MKKLLVSACVAPVFLTQTLVGEKTIYPEKSLLGEENYRLIIAQEDKDLVTKFYYFDGEQTFALFENPKKEKFNTLIVVVPTYVITEFSYIVNGVKKKFEGKDFALNVGQFDTLTKSFKGEAYSLLFGRWFTSSKEESIVMKLVYERSNQKWILRASKDTNGKWTGSMKKSE